MGDLLFKNVKMPTGCHDCKVLHLKFDMYYCPFLGDSGDVNCVDEEVEKKVRHSRCPISQEIATPHGRLKDADEIIKNIADMLNREVDPLGYDAIEALSEVEYANTLVLPSGG